MPAYLFLFIFTLFFGEAFALTIVGVIASERGGIALVKLDEEDSTKVFREGDQIRQNMSIRKIARDFVDLEINGRIEKARVGEEISTEIAPISSSYKGIERQGNSVMVSAQLKDHILRNELGKVLMQAAAVPHYISGELRGFRLWEIDPGSIYELAGFQNGDIVTAINGSEIVDVGGAVRLLQSLKEATDVSVNLTREGQEQTLTISVH